MAPATVAANGLSTPVPYDSDGNGMADTVYAGDLSGNLWKFDLGINPAPGKPNPYAAPSNWKVAFGPCATTAAIAAVGSTPAVPATVTCTPLFAAGAAKPITTPPTVASYPSGGVMVLFGTGKYLESADSTATAAQSFYGIYDAGAAVAGTGSLIPHHIDSTKTSTLGGNNYRTAAAYLKDCVGGGSGSGSACPAPFKGWYLNFPDNMILTTKGPAERTTGSPKLVLGTLLFNTFIPSNTPCDYGGTGWLMAVDYATGDIRPFNVFDTDGSGKFDGGDTAAAGVQVGAALGGSTIIENSRNITGNTGNNTGVGESSLTTGNNASTLLNFGGLPERPPCKTCFNRPSPTKGRLNWREIMH